MKTFSELSLSAPLKSNLAKHGFAQPTPVQAQSIPPALAGRDLVATAQTGTGKTLAFVLPVIHRLQKLPSPYGIRAVIQPGGSKRDADVIAAADEHGMAMVFTGMRHFRH